MAQRQQRLGQAQATANNRAAGIKLFNIYREERHLVPFEQMLYTEIEGDNLNNLFLSIAQTLSSRPIPYNATSNFMPRNPENKRCLMASTLTKYIGQIKEAIREKFPQHPNFSDGDPDWYAGLIAAFERDCNRLHLKIKGNEDVVFGDQNCHPLYRGAEASSKTVGDVAEEFMWLEEAPDDDTRIVDHISLIDMKYVTRRILKSANTIGNDHFEKRAWLVILFLGCGRGGEIKFIDYSEWQWYPYLEVLDTRWTELKNMEKYAMGFVPDRESYLLDIYHALGCFYLFRGLYRTQDQIQKSLGNYLFPSLHCMADNSVATNITRVLRQHLPRHTPPDVVSQVSSRSTRKGAVSQMAGHRECDLFETVARTGHATGINIDYYTDKNNVERSLIGARVLSGWGDTHRITKVPRLECLGVGNKEAVRRLMDQMFVISVDFFNPRGRLFPVIKTVGASMVMYHNQVTDDLGPGNAVTTKMEECARLAAIVDPRFPSLSPEATLVEWSKIIREDFESRNPEIAIASANLESMSSSINQMAACITSLKQELHQTKRQLEESAASHAHRFAQMKSHYSNEASKMQETIMDLRHKLSVFKTPTKSHETPAPSRTLQPAAVGPAIVAQPTAAAVPTSAGAGNDEEDYDDDYVLQRPPIKRRRFGKQTPPTAVTASPQATLYSDLTDKSGSMEEAHGHSPFEMFPAELKWGSDAEYSCQQTNKGLKAKQIFEFIHVKCCWHHHDEKWKDISPPAFVKEKSHFKFVMEIAEYVADHDIKKILIKHPSATEEKKRLDAYEGLQKAIMRKLIEFEGGDPTKPAPKTAGRTPEPTLSGIAARVKKHKVKIFEGNPASASKWSEVPLVERNQIGKPPTPKDCQNIGKFFSAKKKT